MVGCMDGITNSMDMSLSKLRDLVMDREAWHAVIQRVTKRHFTECFIFVGSKITVEGDCSHDMKSFLLGRKATTNLDSILKSNGTTWQTKVHTVKAMVFPLVIYGWESWIIKKPGHRRIDAFGLWSWRRLLRQQGDS